MHNDEAYSNKFNLSMKKKRRRRFSIPRNEQQRSVIGVHNRSHIDY
jgi:hypothetical protein